MTVSIWINHLTCLVGLFRLCLIPKMLICILLYMLESAIQILWDRYWESTFYCCRSRSVWLLLLALPVVTTTAPTLPGYTTLSVSMPFLGGILMEAIESNRNYEHNCRNRGGGGNCIGERRWRARVKRTSNTIKCWCYSYFYGQICFAGEGSRRRHYQYTTQLLTL